MRFVSIIQTLFICVIIGFLYACAQNGNRLDEMEARVVVMNERIERMQEHSSTHIERRQELLERIMSEIEPIQEIHDSGNQPINTENQSTGDTVNPGDIQSVPIEELNPPPPRQMTANPVELAEEAYNQKDYNLSAYYYYEAYQNQEYNNEIRESSLFKAGESLYLKEDWQQAADLFLNFMKQYPESTHMPTVLYQIGKSYQSLQQTEKSNAVFEYLRMKFPASLEAQKVTN